MMLAWAYYHSRHWRPALLFVAIALVVGLPWYAYNAIHAGNPFSPFAGEVFGHWPWQARDAAAQIRQLGKQGFGHQPIALLMLPYNLVVNHWSFSSPEVPLILMAIFPCFFSIPWMNRKIRPFAVLLLTAMTIWIFSSQVLRYLAAFLPLWCFLSVWFLTYLIALFGKAPLLRRMIGLHAKRLHYVASSVVLALVLYHYSENQWLLYPSKATEMMSNRESFLQKKISEYGLIDHLRTSDIEGRKIYQVDVGALLTYVRNNRVIGDSFGILGTGYLADKYGRNAKGVICELFENNVSFIAIGRDSFDRPKLAGWRKYFGESLVAEYEDENTVLFSLAAGHRLCGGFVSPSSASREGNLR